MTKFCLEIQLSPREQQKVMEAIRIVDTQVDTLCFIGHQNEVLFTLNNYLQALNTQSVQSNRINHVSQQYSHDIGNEQQAQQQQYQRLSFSQNQLPNFIIKTQVLIFLIIKCNIRQFPSFQDKIYKIIDKNLDGRIVNFVLIDSRQEALEYVGSLEKLKNQGFQQNYNELTQKVQKQSQSQLLSRLLNQRLKWTQNQINIFLAQNNIVNFQGLFEYKNQQNCRLNAMQKQTIVNLQEILKIILLSQQEGQENQQS